MSIARRTEKNPKVRRTLMAADSLARLLSLTCARPPL